MKNKPKITIGKKSKETTLERDIMMAGFPKASKQEIQFLQEAASSDDWTFEFSPEVIEQLSKLDLTPEDVIEMIKNEKTKTDSP